MRNMFALFHWQVLEVVNLNGRFHTVPPGLPRNKQNCQNHSRHLPYVRYDCKSFTAQGKPQAVVLKMGSCAHTLEFESHGNENWHAPGSTDVHDSHGLMFITLLVDTSCNAVAQILHMQIRFPGLSNGASLATAIPESPRRPLHI